MPIEVACPKCEATLSAPDSSAGKKIRCPECQALVSVPSVTLQFADEEPPPREKPRLKKKKARVPDDDDDRPRKKRTKARAVTQDEDEEDDEDDDSPGYSGRPSKIPPPVWIAYAACLLAILIGIGVSISIINDAQERERLAREGKLVPTGGAGGVDDTAIDPGGMPDPQDNP